MWGEEREKRRGRNGGGGGASLGLLPGLRPEQSLVKELGGGGQRGEGGGQSARLH